MRGRCPGPLDERDRASASSPQRPLVQATAHARDRSCRIVVSSAQRTPAHRFAPSDCRPCVSASSTCGSCSTQRVAPAGDSRFGRNVVMDPSGTTGVVGRAIFLAVMVSALAMGMPAYRRTFVFAWRYRAINKNSSDTTKWSGSVSATRSLCGISQSDCTTSAAKTPRCISIRSWASPP